MPAFFSKVFRGRDGAGASSLPASSVSDEASHTPSKSQWKDAWLRTQVEPEEVQRLLHGCTLEVKSRGTPDRAPRAEMDSQSIRTGLTEPC